MTDQDPLDGAAAGLEEPALDAAALERAESEAAAEAAVDAATDGPAALEGPASPDAPGAASGDTRGATRGEEPAGAAGSGKLSDLTSADYAVAFSPRQVAIGLAIVAGLVALVVRRRRRRTPREDG